MKRIDLSKVLPSTVGPADRLTTFGLLCLGVVESLSSGTIGAGEAIKLFFHAENCAYVRKLLKDAFADEAMSHGVQLVDIFDALPPEEAQREFQHELAEMHRLCLQLLEMEKAAA